MADICMEPYVAYEVTRASSNGAFKEGDIVIYCDDDGVIVRWDKVDPITWLDVSESSDAAKETLDFECTVSRTVYVHNDHGTLTFGYIPQTDADQPWSRQLRALARLEGSHEE